MWVITPFLKVLIPVIAKEFLKEIDKDINNFEEFVRTVINNRYEFISKNQEIFCIVIKEFLYKDKLMEEFIPHISNHVRDFINATFDKFKASGEIIDLPNPVIIRVILSSVFGYFTMRFLLLKKYNISGKEEEIELLVRFISRGLKAP